MECLKKKTHILILFRSDCLVLDTCKQTRTKKLVFTNAKIDK